MKLNRLCSLGLLAFLIPCSSLIGSPILVTSDADDGSPGTLRWAINEANSNPGHDVINVPEMTITLGSMLPLVSEPLTINGAGPNETIVQPSAVKADPAVNYRIMETDSGIELSLSDLQLRHGHVGEYQAHGGAIRAQGPVNLLRVILRGNVAGKPDTSIGEGGAIFVENSLLNVEDSWFDGNEARSLLPNMGGFATGGAISTPSGGTPSLTIRRTTFTGNRASVTPGSFNDEALGGAISSNAANATVVIDRCTFVGNESVGGEFSIGGAISGVGSGDRIESSTIVNNTAEYRAGGVSASSFGLLLVNTIIAGNNAPADFDLGSAINTYSSGGHNLIGSMVGISIMGDATGNQLGVDPLVATLEHRGRSVGPVMTLQPTSPVIDAGASLAEFDQTGAPRLIGAAVDIGAYEHRELLVVTAPLAPETTGSIRGNHAYFSVNFSGPVDHSSITGEFTEPAPSGGELQFIPGASDGARALATIEGLPAEATFGVRINSGRSIYGDLIPGLPIDSTSATIVNVPGDIDGDGAVDASELNEVILRYRSSNP